MLYLPGAPQTTAFLCLPHCWDQKRTLSRQQCGGACHTVWQNETDFRNAGKFALHRTCLSPIVAPSLCRSTLCSQAHRWSQVPHHHELVAGQSLRGHTKNHQTTWMSNWKSLVSTAVRSVAATMLSPLISTSLSTFFCILFNIINVFGKRKEQIFACGCD